jgi:hypothetical protein
MQIIDGYSSAVTRSFSFEFRLYHLNRPRVLEWRKARHHNNFKLDTVDQLVIDHLPNRRLVSVDAAGWYFNDFGIKTQCLESSEISKLYYPDCQIEFDLLTHKPTYTNSDPIFFKFPWFLKYISVADLVKFLDLWCESILILNFSTRHIQHNYLKYRLVDLVSDLTTFYITEINQNLWIIKKS